MVVRWQFSKVNSDFTRLICKEFGIGTVHTFHETCFPIYRHLSIYNVPSSLIVMKTFSSLLFKENHRFRLRSRVILPAYLTEKKFTIKIRDSKSKDVRIQTMKRINRL